MTASREAKTPEGDEHVSPQAPQALRHASSAVTPSELVFRQRTLFSETQSHVLEGTPLALQDTESSQSLGQTWAANGCRTVSHFREA